MKDDLDFQEVQMGQPSSQMSKLEMDLILDGLKLKRFEGLRQIKKEASNSAWNEQDVRKIELYIEQYQAICKLIKDLEENARTNS